MSIEARLAKLEQQVEQNSKKSESAKRTASEVKRLCSGEILEAAQHDAHVMHSLYKLLHLKLCVATELLFKSRVEKRDSSRIAKSVIEAFDKPDEWWKRRAEMSLEAWELELSDDVKKVFRSIRQA